MSCYGEGFTNETKPTDGESEKQREEEKKNVVTTTRIHIRWWFFSSIAHSFQQQYIPPIMRLYARALAHTFTNICVYICFGT